MDKEKGLNIASDEDSTPEVGPAMLDTGTMQQQQQQQQSDRFSKCCKMQKTCKISHAYVKMHISICTTYTFCKQRISNICIITLKLHRHVKYNTDDVFTVPDGLQGRILYPDHLHY